MASLIEQDDLKRDYTIVPWDETKEGGGTPPLMVSESPAQSKEPKGKCVFECSPQLNKKIALLKHDICELEVDVIVHSTNEQLNDVNSPVALRVLELGGDELSKELAHEAPHGCKTGEAVMTKACNLPARRMVHTVGPRYNEKYHNAAENALPGCYRSCLSILIENKLRTIAFPCVYTKGKCYPREDGAHVALRTVRRYLEHFPDRVDSIVFAVENDMDYSIYLKLLPLYFPRTEEEEAFTRSLLPKDVGNEWGETIIQERTIRIMSLPTPKEAIGEKSNAKSTSKASNTEGPSKRSSFSSFSPFKNDHGGDFTMMVEDIDKKRLKELEKQREAMTQDELNEEQVAEIYHQYLEEAENEDLSDIRKLQVLYKPGCDAYGRPAFVALLKHLPASVIDMKRILLYMIQQMDQTVDQEYVIVLVLSLSTSANQPEFSWLQHLYYIFENKYRKNMKTFYVVHPSIWFRLAVWFMSPFLSSGFWKKIVYINNLRDLFEHFDANQLLLPEFVFRYDRQINGQAYIGQETT